MLIDTTTGTFANASEGSYPKMQVGFVPVPIEDGPALLRAEIRTGETYDTSFALLWNNSADGSFEPIPAT